MVSDKIIVWITSGGFVAVVGTIMRGLYLLGGILESFRSHVKSSDAQHAKFDDRLSYLERRGH
jgi:hypothetical protein